MIRYAVRNNNLCSKDCLCVYVCPTGASNTENNVIDVKKCIGCGRCVDACSAKAIALIPTYCVDIEKVDDEIWEVLSAIFKSKAYQECIAHRMSGKLFRAIELSNRIMAEDIIREAGYLLPQGKNAKEFFEYVKKEHSFCRNTVNSIAKNLDQSQELESFLFQHNNVTIDINNNNYNSTVYPIITETSKADVIVTENKTLVTATIIKEPAVKVWAKMNEMDSATLGEETNIDEGLDLEDIKTTVGQKQTNVSKEQEEIDVQYRCRVCGYIHRNTVAMDFICPICCQDASVFEKC